MTKMMTPLDILEEADRVLSGPETWMQGDLARNAANETVAASSKDAVCFCLSGAIVRAYYNLRNKLEPPSMSVITDTRMPLIQAIRQTTTSVDHALSPIPTYNDRPDTTFEDIKGVITKAIEAENSKGEPR